MICPDNPLHGEMVKNGVKAGKQRYLCMKCGKTATEKKDAYVSKQNTAQEK